MRILLLLIMPILLLSQNLVVNPSFEELKPKAISVPCSYTKQPESFGALNGWSTVAGSTPDILLRPDSLQNCYFPKPQNGKMSVGFINYLPQFDAGYSSDYHEYLQGMLTEPLKPGEKYKIQFWIYHNDSMAIKHVKWLYKTGTPEVLPLATNNIGFYFMERAIPVTRVLQLLNDEPQFNVEEIIKTKKGEWKLITGTFTADKPYRYFIIGNFFLDGATQIDKTEQADRVPDLVIKNGKRVKRIWRLAYYCIDNVSITVDDGIAIAESKPYTFQNVLFVTGKWTLLPGAEEELKELANYILQNPTKQFEIGGHTDNVGDDAANQVLSEKRAKTVYDYLLKLKVNNKQLSYQGYGEAAPKMRMTQKKIESKIAE